MNKQHAVTGHEATAGCLVRISMFKDDLFAWKNYLLTYIRYRKTGHTMIIGVKNIVIANMLLTWRFPRWDLNPEPTHWSFSTEELVRN